METTLSRKKALSLSLTVFSILLAAYPRHPVLWVLYSLNRFLRGMKPLLEKEVCINDYQLVRETDLWFNGDMGDIKDVIIMNDEEGSSGLTAIIGLQTGAIDCGLSLNDMNIVRCRVFYEVPREWCARIIGRKNSKNEIFLYLLPFKFCCRQVLRRSDCGVVQCRSVVVDSKYHLDKTFFHIGCGDCFIDTHDVYNDVCIYTGLKRLDNAMKKYCVEKMGETSVASTMIYALSVPKELTYYILINDGLINYKTPVMHRAEVLKSLLKHILVCGSCFIYLGPFLDLLYRSVIVSQFAVSSNERCKSDIYHNTVPCARYILDGNFDIINDDAYEAPCKYNTICDNICKECVDLFMSKHV
jgi:hypothetical protein